MLETLLLWAVLGPLLLVGALFTWIFVIASCRALWEWFYGLFS